MKKWIELFDNKENGKAIGFVSSIRQDNFGCVLSVKNADRNINLRIWKAEKEELISALDNFIIWNFTYSDYNSKYKSMVIEDIDIVGIKTIENNKDLFDSIHKKIDGDTYFEKVVNYIDNIKDEYLRQQLNKLYVDYKETLKIQRASTKFHHSYKGGLIFHIYQVLCMAISIENDFKGVDKDLIIAGVLLHDIGKIFSYDEEGAITDKEKLIGYHIQGSLQLTYKYLSDYSNLDNLIHIINSHHGCIEWGAIQTPQTLEATIVFTADMLSSHGEYSMKEEL